MADNVGRPNPSTWDESLPLGMYALEHGEARPYREQSKNHRVEMHWKREGLGVGFDDAAHPDFSKGYLVALPGVVGKAPGRDSRTDDEVSRSFGRGLLDFERGAMSLRGLFASYTEAYDANKAAAARMASSSGKGAAKTAFEASKRRMEMAKERYKSTLDSVLKYCDRAYENNSEVMTRITLRGRNGGTLDNYPIPDKRDHDEVARVLTFGSDEEIAELRRSVELCSMWCNGHTILDVTRAAELIAVTWPERRSEAADLICDAVHRDMVRMLPVIRGNGCNNKRLENRFSEAIGFADDVSEWCNDALVALDCAWLMDPTMMPAARDADTIIEIHMCAEKARERIVMSSLVNQGDVRRDVSDCFRSAADRIGRHVGVFEAVWSDERPMRVPVPGDVPVERLEMLARSVSSGRALDTLHDEKGYMSLADRSALLGDPEAATVAYEGRARFMGKYSEQRVERYHAAACDVRDKLLASQRKAISADIADSVDDCEESYDGSGR